jgi:hypothetical protein
MRLIYTEPVLAHFGFTEHFFAFLRNKDNLSQQLTTDSALCFIRESARFVCRIKELYENDQILRNTMLLRGADQF